MKHNKKKTVTLSIEHKERELYSKCLIAAHLARKGLRVFVGSTEAIDILANALEPSIIFHKSTYDEKSRKYRKMGHKFVFLDEEGGATIQRSRLIQYCSDRYRSLSSESQDMVLLPGENYLKIISSMRKGLNLKVTGWPRVDLWRENYRHVYAEKVREISREYPSFYLFPTSFGSLSINSYENGHDFTPDLTTPDQERRKAALIRYIKFLKEISLLLRWDEKIVVRPHHSEDVRFWEKIFVDYENVIIRRDGDISAWILSSKNTIQWGSTSAIQAAFLGYSNVQYKVEPTAGLTDTPSFELCQNANTPTEAIELLRGPSYSPKMAKKARDILVEQMFFSEEKLATDFVAESLDGLDTGKVKPPKLSLARFLTISAIYFGSNLKRRLGNLGFQFVHKGQTIAEKIPGGITKDEVSSILCLIDACENQSSNFKLTQYAPNLVCIE